MNFNLTATAGGQILTFSYLYPLRGLDTINHFSDQITGETADRFFVKEFSYTLDGINYTPYETLNLANLQAITFTAKDDLIFRFKYTRSGSDNTGNLTVDWVKILGVYTLSNFNVLTFDNPVFRDIFITNEFFNKSWITLLEKLVERGITPEFVERTEDFVLFNKANAYFFALLMTLNKINIDDFFSNESNVFNYLREFTVFPHNSASLSGLITETNTLLERMNERSSIRIFDEDGNFFSQVTANPNHGEFRNLINYEYRDEFIWDFMRENGYLGITSGNEYSGGTEQRTSNKINLGGNSLDRYGPGITSLDDFEVATNVSLGTDGDKEVIFMNSNSVLTTKKIKVSNILDYQLFFQFYSDFTFNFTVEVRGYDSAGNLISLQNHQQPNANASLLSDFDIQQSGRYNFFRGFIFSKDSTSVSVSKPFPNDGGNNLRFTDEVFSIDITITNDTTRILNIYDLFLKPRVYPNLNYLDGQVFTSVWFINRNVENFTEMINNISRYLLPLDSKFAFTLLGSRQVGENEYFVYLLNSTGAWLLDNGDPWLA